MMSHCGLVVFVIWAIAGVYFGILMLRPISSFSDSIKCPFCYGMDLCKDVDSNKITLEYKSFSDFFYNVFSVKNLYFADYKGERVVLKKLGQRRELDNIRNIPVTREILLRFIDSVDSGSRFKSCNRDVSESFLNSVSLNFGLEQLWTILQVNVEPLILSLFQAKNFPVPKIYGTCGFLIIEEYCGLSLNYFQNSPWHIRAFLALQLLKASVDFTFKHDKFRLYLTDLSPDNIVVNDNLTVYFIDLENVILQRKLEDNKTHYSEHFADEAFVYSEEEVCRNSISDHNVYAVCRLLLSRTAPWPMMPNGLLHSTPSHIEDKGILTLVEECVDSTEKYSRFDIAGKLITILEQVIE